MSRATGGSGARSVTDRRPRLVRVAIPVVVVLAVIGVALYWAQANTPRSYEDLRSDPAFALRMPGADELGEVGSEAWVSIGGRSAAFAGHIFGTTLASADVYAFYDRELAQLGWRVESPPYVRSSVELQNKEYCKAKTGFSLAIKDKDRAFQPSFYKGKSYVTVFDARLIASSPGQPCPSPPLAPTTPIP